ncbi:MAG: phospholipase D-like domain-containing protein [Bacteroidota bacterium]
MSELLDLFRETLEDELFSRAERQALTRVIKEERPDERELGVLRSDIYKMIREKMDDPADRRLLDWLYNANKVLIPKPSKSSRSKDSVYFSPGRDCQHAIQHHLRQAHNKVDICVFTISDNEITDEIKAAHRRGIKVRILTDNDKVWDRGSDIEHLASQGITVKVDRTEYHMHHKFALIDQQVLLTGSYNWTRSAHKYNEENLLITHAASTVQAYQREFDQLWRKLETFT